MLQYKVYLELTKHFVLLGKVSAQSFNRLHTILWYIYITSLLITNQQEWCSKVPWELWVGEELVSSSTMKHLENLFEHSIVCKTCFSYSSSQYVVFLMNNFCYKIRPCSISNFNFASVIHRIVKYGYAMHNMKLGNSAKRFNILAFFDVFINTHR